ncbi:MAG: 23S rRNA (uracil(1939)-C(5))-methyltransferase RlmD [Candidatus Marinimicrobia bacterium]|nr:23S rRNA (uracil(1939)-C(5))-methyltransferase RlmD [Candidatus Neomarinimicrobiota bacterium]
MTKPVRKGDIVDLRIEKLVYGGKGLARYNDYVVFVKNCVPGQKIKAKIYRAKSSYGEAHPIRILEHSAVEIEPACPYFEHCGGCNHQDIAYDDQLKFKQKQVRDLYSRMGGFDNIKFESIADADRQFRYRNKMEFAFSAHRWLMHDFEAEKPHDFALGLRAPGYYWKAVDIDDCLIAPEETEQVLDIVRTYALKNDLQPYSVRDHTGYLRHLVLRKSAQTDQLMIIIVTNQDTPEKIEALSAELASKIPNLSSFINSYTTNVGGTTLPEKTHLLYGKDHIIDKIDEHEFIISPNSFFQTNTGMAAKLYTIIKEKAELNGDEIIWDLYSGTGSISIYLADQARQIIGFEIVPEAVQDAHKNAKRNNVDNLKFIEGNLDNIFRKQAEILEKLPHPDAMIIDPPRAGMHPKLVQNVIEIAPRKIVYVSCKPSTQVRDVNKLVDAKYAINSVKPVDMFPQTSHIEVVTRLTKK